jgi:hypothetical protein
MSPKLYRKIVKEKSGRVQSILERTLWPQRWLESKALNRANAEKCAEIAKVEPGDRSVARWNLDVVPAIMP